MTDSNLDLEATSSASSPLLLHNSHSQREWWATVNNEPIVSPRELYAWTFYAFGSEVYAVVALSFMPLILERLAAKHGVITTDYKTPCEGSIELVTFEKVRCVVDIFGHWVDTASFSLYTFSISVCLQAITAISIGSAADHGSMRKTLLLTFSFVGSVAAMLFLVQNFMILSGFAIVSNVCFGASIVCLNGFLPVLVKNQEEVRKLVTDIQAYCLNRSSGNNHAMPMDENDQEQQVLLSDFPETDSDTDSSDPELNSLISNLTATKERLAARISANGMAAGYFGGIILMTICLGISLSLKGSIFSLQLGVSVSGIWWFLVSTFLLLSGWLKPRPGPPFKLENGVEAQWYNYVTYSWTRLWRTILEAKKLTMTFRFLVAWFLLSDGYTTISSVALLFAQTVLQIPPTGVILIGLIAPIAALIGTITFPRIQARTGHTTKQTILITMMLFAVIPLYGSLGFILPVGGLKSPFEIYVLAVWFGFLLGPIQSYCRSLFAELIPSGRETEFFALYAVTDKGSSWLGPMLVAIVTDLTHEIRYGFLLLLVLLMLPIPIMKSVNVKKGREDAAAAE